jgi:hypothetical protein
MTPCHGAPVFYDTDRILKVNRTHLKIDFCIYDFCHRERRRRVAISKSLIVQRSRLLHFVRNDSFFIVGAAHFNFEIGSNDFATFLVTSPFCFYAGHRPPLRAEENAS